MNSLYATAIRELGNVFEKIDDAAVDKAVDMIASARAVTVFGCGRERLQLLGFAMRLFHMGRPVAVVGDVTAPPAGPGTLFIATVGPGQLATAEALLKIARDAGATTMVLTAQPKGRACQLADFVLTIPAQTMADDQGPNSNSVLPMGSLFEGALFVLFEVMVLKLKDAMGIGMDEMRARHTNLE